MPRLGARGMTQSPLLTVEAEAPAERTSKQASLPGVAVGVGVPRAVVKGGEVG